MRFKPVPEPPADLAFVETVWRSVPETAGAVDDCCAHLLEETPIADRDEAATWLTFLRALELATEESAGYRRRSPGPSDDADTALERDRLRRAFRERVDGTEAILAVLADAVEHGSTSPDSQTRRDADRALTAAAVADAVSDGPSDGERRARRTRIEEDRIERLLEWAVLLGLAERAENGIGYRLARGREEK
ncbi:hypothetical protein [Natrinema sp. 1APR25-10V2]|uniref:hypothetical protein n=1 Tax=Natrinema sp. 1APR25-10V2 TaxID=2951081 RepID=UPI002874E000|nr:hypothetical protein [Natrinema sp. 1APR25-10V2]MDS0475485.1 hypothetical protein [Natrinema sp. 1APR25-10V2]